MGWRRMDFIKKILNVLKSILEWLVAIALILSGYLLFKHIKEKFFGPSQVEKDIINDIKTNEKKIDELEKISQDKIQEEKKLQEEQIEVQKKMDKLKEEYHAKEKEFSEREKEIGNSTHQENIDYINKKYRG